VFDPEVSRALGCFSGGTATGNQAIQRSSYQALSKCDPLLTHNAGGRFATL
jgi:hypothetical protein